MEQQIEPNRSVESVLDREIANQPKDNIPGWGIDHDPENDPTYPMKHGNGADHERLNYEKPVQQPLTVEVLHSIERPGVTRVFGTSTPPAGLSGKIRRFAFKYSESTYAHWFPLIVADRVSMVEGIIDDFRNGIVPNIFAERGWSGEWKYNKKGVIKTGAIVLGAATFLYLVRFGGRSKR